MKLALFYEYGTEDCLDEVCETYSTEFEEIQELFKVETEGINNISQSFAAIAESDIALYVHYNSNDSVEIQELKNRYRAKSFRYTILE